MTWGCCLTCCLAGFFQWILRQFLLWIQFLYDRHELIAVKLYCLPHRNHYPETGLQQQFAVKSRKSRKFELLKFWDCLEHTTFSKKNCSFSLLGVQQLVTWYSAVLRTHARTHKNKHIECILLDFTFIHHVGCKEQNFESSVFKDTWCALNSKYNWGSQSVAFSVYEFFLSLYLLLKHILSFLDTSEFLSTNSILYFTLTSCSVARAFHTCHCCQYSGRKMSMMMVHNLKSQFLGNGAKDNANFSSELNTYFYLVKFWAF